MLRTFSRLRAIVPTLDRFGPEPSARWSRDAAVYSSGTRRKGVCDPQSWLDSAVRVHLENNVLFPRALQLAEAGATG